MPQSAARLVHCEPECPNTERVDKHEKVLFGGESPEQGVVHRFLVIELLLRWAVGILGANLLAILVGLAVLISLVQRGTP
jgi:hypothetical protein